MKIYYQTLFFLFATELFPINLLGQINKMDSLERIVNNYPHADTFKINRLIDLETQYHNKDVNSFGKYKDTIKNVSFVLHYNYGISKGYYISSCYELLKGNFLTSLDEIYKSIDYARLDNNPILLATSYGQLSFLLSRNAKFSNYQSNNQNAQSAIEKGVEYAFESKNPLMIHKLLIRAVLINIEQKDYVKARVLLEKCKQNYAILLNKDYLSDILLQDGSLSVREGKYSQALEKLFELKEIEQKDKGSNLLGLVYLHIGNAYNKLGENTKSEFFYLKALSETTKSPPHVKLEIYKSLKDLYIKTNNFKEALHYYEEQFNFNDSINKANNSHDFSQLMLKYNTALKDKENQELKHQNQIKQRNLNFTIAALFILTLLIGLLTYLYRKLLHTKQQLSISNKELESSNQKKDVIFKIVSHDLKMPTNNLLILTKKLDSNVFSITKEWIQDYSKKINLIVVELVDTVNNLLYWSNKEANHSAPVETIYVYDCIYDILETFTIYAKLLNKSVHFESKNKDITITCNRIHFYTLVKNFLSNAIKYSANANGKILISSSLENNKVLVSIEDNGVGISDETIKRFNSGEIVSESHLKGMGFKICKEIANNYNIEVKFTQSEQLGGSKINLII